MSINDRVVKIPVVKADHAKDIPLPCYMTDGSSGMDIYAAVEEDVLMLAGERALIPTGIYVAVPYGYELQVRPRSGLAIKHGIGILNAPGTIDSDYRGEIKIIMINMGQERFTVKRGDRVAQIVLCPVARANFEKRDELPPTERSDGGFGHTG
jgi:dUTP pyrophosphatase